MDTDGNRIDNLIGKYVFVTGINGRNRLCKVGNAISRHGFPGLVRYPIYDMKGMEVKLVGEYTARYLVEKYKSK